MHLIEYLPGLNEQNTELLIQSVPYVALTHNLHILLSNLLRFIDLPAADHQPAYLARVLEKTPFSYVTSSEAVSLEMLVRAYLKMANAKRQTEFAARCNFPDPMLLRNCTSKITLDDLWPQTFKIGVVIVRNTQVEAKEYSTRTKFIPYGNRRHLKRIVLPLWQFFEILPTVCKLFANFSWAN